MLWIHPILQLLCTVLACYVMYMGFLRFKVLHLKKKAMFPWKRHVNLGQIVLPVWFLGIVLGLFFAQYEWGNINMTDAHFWVGISMAPLILVGFITGLIIRKPARRAKTIPAIHGICNTAAFLLSLYQVYSGIGVISLFLLD